LRCEPPLLYDEVEAVAREVARRYEPIEVPVGDVAAVPPGRPNDGSRFRLRPLAEVQPRQIRWLLPGLIPLRALTLVAGVGGLGKSTWLAGVAARLTRGELNGGDPGDVILISYEDAAAEVLRPRIEVAGGDVSRVHEMVVERPDLPDPLVLPR